VLKTSVMFPKEHLEDPCPRFTTLEFEEDISAVRDTFNFFSCIFRYITTYNSNAVKKRRNSVREWRIQNWFKIFLRTQGRSPWYPLDRRLRGPQTNLILTAKKHRSIYK